jgi:hypothetical protein
MCLLLTGGIVSWVACGTTAVTPPEAGVDALPVCLTSIAQNGDSCSLSETMLCTAAIACDPTPQQAACYCIGGKWQCSYQALDGGIIPPHTTPKCFDEIDAAPGTCPTGEPTGVVSCDQPGLICSYTGLTCPDSDSGQPNIDTCQCAPSSGITVPDGAIESAGDGGLFWSCDRQLCNPTSDAAIPPPPDAGKPDTGFDSGMISDAKSGS